MTRFDPGLGAERLRLPQDLAARLNRSGLAPLWNRQVARTAHDPVERARLVLSETETALAPPSEAELRG